MNKDIDVVIYGATGFTGQLCVKYFQSLDLEINWAIAGRNKEKLQDVAFNLAPNVEILIADSNDEEDQKLFYRLLDHFIDMDQNLLQHVLKMKLTMLI